MLFVRRDFSLFGNACHKGILFPSAPPTPASPAVAPSMNSQAVQSAQQQQVAATEETSGRRSTILSDYANSGKTLG